jgi:hypothetical protein
MIPAIRQQYNDSFTELKYQQMIADIQKDFPGSIEFRLAETPVFIDAVSKDKFIQAGDAICSVITAPNFRAITQNALQNVATPPNEESLPDCLVMDFAICQDADGSIHPKLIELQGFPSLFALEMMHDKAFRASFSIPTGFTPYLNGLDEHSYLQFFEKTLKGTNNKKTVLLELFPDQQKTKLDFYLTQQCIHIPIVCVSEITTNGNQLFYERDGIQYPIERIYNRVVWDELPKQPIEIQEKANLLLQDLAIEWVNHPNHYYRISKYLMPFLQNPFVPKTVFVSALDTIPSDLENYVLKPLFSFAGQGVIIDVEPHHISDITNPENWILQEKVDYSNGLVTPTGNAKVELRLFYFLDKSTGKYIATCNLARISKGKMIGVSYNNTATWVGGSIAYFEADSL